MIFGLIDELTKYIKKKDINEDNFACKLVYRGTVAFLFVATGLAVGNSLFGEPIKCLGSIGHEELNFDDGGLTEPFGEIWIISINAGHKIKLSMTDSYIGQNSRTFVETFNGQKVDDSKRITYWTSYHNGNSVTGSNYDGLD